MPKAKAEHATFDDRGNGSALEHLLPTVYAVAGDPSAAAGRLPQLLTQLADWIAAGPDAGRIAAGLAAGMLGSDARAIFGEAAGLAAGLAAILADAHNLTATVRAAEAAAAP